MENQSIISIPDSDSDITAVMNSTYSPQQPTVTPKKEMDSTINTTFTPEDKKGQGDDAPAANDTTFSPVKEDDDDEELKEKPKARPAGRPMTRARSKTPVREKTPENVIFKFDSPEPSPVPEIVIVPPSTERKRFRNSNKTPTKATRISATPTRRSTRHTPMKPVPEVPPNVKADPVEPEEVRAPMVQSPVLLKSIRKRSMSVADLDPPASKRNFRVQFHSPANMERTITEIDESLHMNYSRTFAATTDEPVFKQPARRKRSLSNAETPSDKLATMQRIIDDKKAAAGGQKVCPSPSPRRKMPNFAAIHQSIFQQMESLGDFTERKKERAKALLNLSGGPLFGASAGGGGAMPNILKPVNRGAIGKAKDLTKRAPSKLLKPTRGIYKRPAQQQSAAMKITENKFRMAIANSDFTIPSADDAKEDDDLEKPVREDKPIKDEEKEPIKETVDAPVADKQVEEPMPAVVNSVAVKENSVVATAKASKIKEPKSIAKDWKINLNVSSNRLKNRAVVNSLANKAKMKTTIPRSQPIIPAPAKPLKVAAPDANETAQLNSTSTFTMIRGVRTNRHFDLLMKQRAMKK